MPTAVLRWLLPRQSQMLQGEADLLPAPRLRDRVPIFALEQSREAQIRQLEPPQQLLYGRYQRFILPTRRQECSVYDPAYKRSQPIQVRAGRHTPRTVKGAMSRSHSLSPELALLGVEEPQPVLTTAPEPYSTTVAWTPTVMVAALFTEAPLAAPMPSDMRSYSYGMVMAANVAWTDLTATGFQQYWQAGTPQRLVPDRAAFQPRPLPELQSRRRMAPPCWSVRGPGDIQSNDRTPQLHARLHARGCHLPEGQHVSRMMVVLQPRPNRLPSPTPRLQ